MTLTFSLHENFDFAELNNLSEHNALPAAHLPPEKTDEIRLIAEKLEVPEFKKYLERPRLIEHLKNSVEQFGATLINGRAGTGKTALAADFAREYEFVAWYSVESTDNDWRTFSHYFVSSICKSGFVLDARLELCDKSIEKNLKGISHFIASVFNNLSESANRKPLLIVLDDIHNIFDNDWFSDFFYLLVHSLLPSTHLLLLSRSQPVLPLWRMRSKQILGVIDEKLLAFNLDETEQFYRLQKLPLEKAKKAHRDSFGRISKLMSLVRNIKSAGN